MPTTYRLPYILHEPSEETGDMYMGEVPLLPGCRAWADTPEEALWILEGNAEAFIASYRKRGKPLPREIVEAGEFVVAV